MALGRGAQKVRHICDLKAKSKCRSELLCGLGWGCFGVLERGFH